MKAIIPTGGRGTRMQPLTYSTNKHFIPVANKLLIFYPIEAVVEAGIKDILITYNPGWLEYVKKHLGNGKKWGVKITYVLQKEPKGLANIVQVCEKELAGSPFLLHLGDNIFADGIKELVDYFLTNKPNGLVPMLRHRENKRMGVPYFDKKGQLKKYIEKPSNPPHDFAVPGLYFADNTFFKAFKGEDKVKPSKRGEYEIPDPFQWMIDHGYSVEVKEYKGKWLDPGKFDDWIESNRYLLDTKLASESKTKVKSNVKLEGRIKIGKKCKIQESEIRGPVSIGDNVTIKNSYVGPFTSIYDECEVVGSYVENSVLMQGSKILNIARPIDNSLIGSNSLIGNSNSQTGRVSLFVGEKSVINI